MKKLLQIVVMLMPFTAFQAFAHHPAADMVDAETYEMIDNLVADTPHAEMTVEDFGNDMTTMTLTTSSVSSLENLLDDGVLIYLQTLEGEVDVNISFNEDGSATMTAIQTP